MKNSNNDNLEKIRHSTAHLLAAALLKIRPKAKLAIGPAIDNGFYYDVDLKSPLKEEDLKDIEKEMKKILKNWKEIKQFDLTRKEALEMYKNNPYKQELIKEHSKKDSDKLSFYKHGDFIDLCKGPHIENPKKDLKAFKLLSIAGAYWRGDEKNKMLTRIYGTAFETKEELKEYLDKLKEAKERNHRKIGKEMKLFKIFNDIGQGLPVWLPNGYAMRRVLEDYMLNLERRYGYQHILTPNIYKEDIFKTSGHLDFYKDSMYAPIKIDDETYYLKPMNCPGGMKVYNSELRSYKDLPIKMGELGTVYRYEQSGELHGLQRVRGFTQNDAHIFCTPKQLEKEIEEILEILEIFYKDVGFNNYKYRLSLSDPDKSKFQKCGAKKDWDWAEETLRKVLQKNNLDFYEAKGEAVFYGPKIDVQAINVFGKEDSISTIQIDFNLPERFGLKYIDKESKEKYPFVIHRALIGSFERFFAFLIEHHGGNFPLWLSPKQVIVLPISDKFIPYAQKVQKKIKTAGNKYNLWIRTEIDDRSERLQAKIRDAEIQKIPYILVVGGKDEEADTVSVRIREKGDIGAVKTEVFIKDFIGKIKTKTLEL